MSERHELARLSPARLVEAVEAALHAARTPDATGYVLILETTLRDLVALARVGLMTRADCAGEER